MEVIVVDNGSMVDPTTEAQRLLPGTRVIRNDTNIGFAAGNNLGAAAATGDYVIFLNDDTRVHPDWLRELIETARRRGAAAVASYILDWSGATVDFVDGALNFQGKGFQLDYGAPVGHLTPEEKPLLFACGCAMLVDRAVLAEVGGWEKVRLPTMRTSNSVGDCTCWVTKCGSHRGRLCTTSITARRDNGRSLRASDCMSAIPFAPSTGFSRQNRSASASCSTDAYRRSRAPRDWFEPRRRGEAGAAYRRWLRAGKAADSSLEASGIDAIPRAMRQIWSGGLWRWRNDVHRLSAADRGAMDANLYRIERGGMPATFDMQPQPIPITSAAAMLSGIYGFLSEIPQLAARRADLQPRRRVTDREILGRFGAMWLAPSGARLQSAHSELHTALVDEFGLAALNQQPAAPGGAGRGTGVIANSQGKAT